MILQSWVGWNAEVHEKSIRIYARIGIHRIEIMLAKYAAFADYLHEEGIA